MRVYVFIPTCNRPREINRLASDLLHDAQASGIDLRLALYDDGSKRPVRVPEARIRRYTRPHGRERYWQLINDALRDARTVYRESGFDYLIMLPDDAIIKRGFFQRAVRLFRALPEEETATLSLIYNRKAHRPNWTAFKPVPERIQGLRYLRTQWVDGCFITSPRALSWLRWRLNPIWRPGWRKSRILGSGVGQQMSKRYHRLGKRLYNVTEKLVVREDIPSVMFPGFNRIHEI